MELRERTQILDFVHYLRYHATPREYPSDMPFKLETKFNSPIGTKYRRIAYTTHSCLALDIRTEIAIYTGKLPKDLDLHGLSNMVQRLVVFDNIIYGQKFLPWGIQYICYRPLPKRDSTHTDDYDYAGRRYIRCRAWTHDVRIVRVFAPYCTLTCDTIKNMVHSYTLFAKVPHSYKDISIT
jgi:hypothetical protein